MAQRLPAESELYKLIMVRMRPFEFDLTPFAGDEMERVRVMAENRALGFSLAASQATDPNNVWKVGLRRDDRRYLNLSEINDTQVPREFASSRSYPLPDEVPKRWYSVCFYLFGGVQADEGVYVSGRVNAFTAGVAASDTPDAICEIWLEKVSKEQGDDLGGYYIDESKKYGGVTVDLEDPMIPVPSGSEI